MSYNPGDAPVITRSKILRSPTIQHIFDPQKVQQ
jgi:hypothetical protein